jgi:nitronate monooxygenase
VAACSAGVIGTFPALNQRTTEGLRDWLRESRVRLAGDPSAAPFGVNLVVHRSKPRHDADLNVCVEEEVPIVITSLGAVAELVERVHGCGGLVFHDVINLRHSRKAAEAGVDGIIAVAAGAGGHGGTLSPFALVSEIWRFFDGAIILAGAINTCAQVAAARMMGADLAYLGTRFLTTRESLAQDGFKRMVLDSTAADILYTPKISGVNANFLRPSIAAADLDPEALEGRLDMEGEARVWRDIWTAGHGVGTIDDIPPVRDLCLRLRDEYDAALRRAAAEAAARGLLTEA